MVISYLIENQNKALILEFPQLSNNIQQKGIVININTLQVRLKLYFIRLLLLNRLIAKLSSIELTMRENIIRHFS